MAVDDDDGSEKRQERSRPARSVGLYWRSYLGSLLSWHLVLLFLHFHAPLIQDH
jgi:hypothetical protein